MYYKKENSTLEEDFFVRTQNEPIPVEVKSNNNRSKSLVSMIHKKISNACIFRFNAPVKNNQVDGKNNQCHTRFYKFN